MDDASKILLVIIFMIVTTFSCTQIGIKYERHRWCNWYANDSIEKFELCKDKPPYKE